MRAIPQLRQLTTGEKAVTAGRMKLALTSTHATGTAVVEIDGLRGSSIRDPQGWRAPVSSPSSAAAQPSAPSTS